MSQRIWDRGTRWLHWGLSLAVTFQLFVSLVMEVPQPGLRPQALGLQGFRAHKVVGAALIAIVLVHWLWTLRRAHGQAIRHLFPWGRFGRAEIVADLRNLKGGKLPEGRPRRGAPGVCSRARLSRRYRDGGFGGPHPSALRGRLPSPSSPGSLRTCMRCWPTSFGSIGSATLSWSLYTKAAAIRS